MGPLDKARGTLFREIIDVLSVHRPEYVILENVGNFEQHDHGRTWRVVKSSLRSLGYYVSATEHVKSGGTGLLSPHHLGFPQTRERFYIVAHLGTPLDNVFPARLPSGTSVESILQAESEIAAEELPEVALNPTLFECIELWNALLRGLPAELKLPWFPIWGDEATAQYPFTDRTPATLTKRELLACLDLPSNHMQLHRDDILALLPPYARDDIDIFPEWKQRFIQLNRQWFSEIGPHIPSGWLDRLRRLPASFRKLEWNCQGSTRDLWAHILQFRPSGLRAKRMTTVPALVALTKSQAPIIGPRRRFLTRIEGLRTQGFPDDHMLPQSRDAAFRALGNAVHTGVIKALAASMLAAQTGGQTELDMLTESAI